MATCLICRELLEDGGRKCPRCHGHYCSTHQQPRHHECSGVDWEQRSDSPKIPRPRSPPRNWEKKAEKKLQARRGNATISSTADDFQNETEPLGFLGWFLLLAVLATLAALAIRLAMYFGTVG